MSKYIFICFIILTNTSFASDVSALSFSIRVQMEVERTFLEGQQRYEYDSKKNLVNTWKDKNISAADMSAYMNAYNIAHDLERKIKLSNELKEQRYIYTQFSEHIAPTMVIPLKP